MANSRKKNGTVGELLRELGGVGPDRVLLDPAPGTATEGDLVRLNAGGGRLYELVEGTVVEKPMGFEEGFLEGDIFRILSRFLDRHDLGELGTASASMRLAEGIVRLPDISFIRWERLPGRRRPSGPIPDMYPDLAVEVISEGNTRDEMERKRREYFFAGARLVWEVNPRRREIDVYPAPDACTTLTEQDTLTGGDVLPGFSVPVAEVFARVPRP